MLSGRKAHQQCFPKRPCRTRLGLSCLSASQQELVEAHKCLLGHFGIVHPLSFRNTDGGLKCYPSEGKNRGNDSGTQRLNKRSAPCLWILWTASWVSQEAELGERQQIALG